MSRYDDGELEISLAPSANRRAQNKPADRSSIPAHSHQSQVKPPPVTASPRKKDEHRVGQYSVIRTLGEGSFGKVKLATHGVTGQQVALKIIARKKLISRDMAGRVEREIEYLQLLRHPHIIKLYTVIKTLQEIIMVLEYAGGELFDYIVNHGKMVEAEARRFFQQIICAVEYCHRHKIVHRDLKPENLLLDGDLNVKIADFGLSNIMTDGNFLKTSCGSPNYAAPEVINGKLYAGPEVDVWSCGVILYVLLVGRLPFDDEHIPSLFAKIAKGQYVVPNYMSKTAAALIKKMLAVNPVHRATIEIIREDPWFKMDLPAYLQPPAEDFIDTGVDPTKSINPKTIAPNAAPAVQEKLYNQVTEKISKTMGYGISDVQEALAAEEPSAIKDAYLIVRENKLMEANPTLTDADGKRNPFIAPSPPPAGIDNVPLESLVPDSMTSTIGPTTGIIPTPRPNPLTGAPSPGSVSSIGTDRSGRAYVSKVGVLPSSVPGYHRTFMEHYRSGNRVGSSLSTSHSEVDTPKPQTPSEKAENARRLNPHSRSSQLKLDEANKKPGAMTPVPQKKSRPTKWQFGIRSRNQPLEAIGCIYRALRKLGAEWLSTDDWASRSGSKQEDRNDNSAMNSTNASGASLHHSQSMLHGNSNDRPQFRPVDPNASYRLPADPWVLRVRWKQDGIHPPSAPSSSIDLKCQARSTTSLSSAGGGSTTSHPESSLAVSSPPKSDVGEPIETVVMHIDIQLYEMDPGVYLVDFKCAGYETSEGRLWEEKDITSPFPFLDLASKLIVQLAEAD